MHEPITVRLSTHIEPGSWSGSQLHPVTKTTLSHRTEDDPDADDNFAVHWQDFSGYVFVRPQNEIEKQIENGTNIKTRKQNEKYSHKFMCIFIFIFIYLSLFYALYLFICLYFYIFLCLGIIFLVVLFNYTMAPVLESHFRQPSL